MLDQQDLQYLNQMENRINDRTDAKFADMEARMDAKFAEAEARTNAKFADIEARMDAKFDAAEARSDAKFAEAKAQSDAKFAEMQARMDAKFAEMEERIVQRSGEMMRTIIEGYCEPRFRALAESQQNLLETLAPKSRVEAVEADVDILKYVVRTLSQDVAQLKNAQ